VVARLTVFCLLDKVLYHISKRYQKPHSIEDHKWPGSNEYSVHYEESRPYEIDKVISERLCRHLSHLVSYEPDEDE
jgi:hypothetical protein